MDGQWSARRLRPRTPRVVAAAATAAPPPPPAPAPRRPPRKRAPPKKSAAKSKSKSKTPSKAKVDASVPDLPEEEEDGASQQAEGSPPASGAGPQKAESPPPREISASPERLLSSPSTDPDSKRTEIPNSPQLGNTPRSRSSSPTYPADSQIQPLDLRFSVPLYVDSPLEPTPMFVRFGKTPARRPSPPRPTFAEATPIPIEHRRSEDIHGAGSQNTPRKRNNYLSCLVAFLGIFVFCSSIFLAPGFNEPQLRIADNEVLLPIYEPIVELANILMGFSPVPKSGNILTTSRKRIENICQGPYKWQELHDYPKPAPGKVPNPRRVRARQANMTSLFLSSARNDKGMQTLVRQCKDTERLIQAISDKEDALISAQKGALQDTAQVIEEMQAHLNSTASQDDKFEIYDKSISSWARRNDHTQSASPWFHQRRIIHGYLVSLDKLGKDVTNTLVEVSKGESLEEDDDYERENQEEEPGAPRNKEIPIWWRWLRHPLGSSLELAHLFRNASADFDNISKNIADIEQHIWESCDDWNSEKRAGCPYVWPLKEEDQGPLSLEHFSKDARDRGKSIAASLDWIDLERQVLRSLLKYEHSKGPGLLNGECEVVLDDTGEASGALSSARGWIHPDPLVTRGQTYSSLPLCASTRVFRPSMEKLDCKLPGNVRDGAWKLMGHTFGSTPRTENQFQRINETGVKSDHSSQEARDIVWKHELVMEQADSPWSRVDLPVHEIRPWTDYSLLSLSRLTRSSRLPPAISLPTNEEQVEALERTSMNMRIFIWEYT